jgi:general secretion pathway protein I
MADMMLRANARLVGWAAVVGPSGPPDPTRPGASRASRAQAASRRAASGSAPNKEGFTLIELLVALAVFSLAALALLNLSGENTRSAARVETRTLGGIVAENLAVEAMIAPSISEGTTTGQTPLVGRPWIWTRTVAKTDEPDLMRIHITVNDPDGQAAQRTLFRARTRP